MTKHIVYTAITKANKQANKWFGKVSFDFLDTIKNGLESGDELGNGCIIHFEDQEYMYDKKSDKLIKK